MDWLAGTERAPIRNAPKSDVISEMHRPRGTETATSITGWRKWNAALTGAPGDRVSGRGARTPRWATWICY